MPTPQSSDLHVNQYLTNISVAFVQNPGQFVATRAFPTVPVNKQSDFYPVYDRGDFLRDDMQMRAPATESAGTGYRISKDNYSCDVWALHKDIADQERANADSVFALDREATVLLAQKRLIRMERDFADTHMTTGVWTGSTTGSDLVGSTNFTQWDDAASTPIEDVRSNARAILGNTGYRPNKLIVSQAVWDALIQHPDIVDRIKHTSAGVVSTQLVAQLMELDEILVSQAVRNTAQEGLTASVSSIVGKSALLAYAPSTPSLYQPSAGYTFEWTGLMGSAGGQRIKTFRMEPSAADRVEIEAAWDTKVVSSVLGAFFSAAVA